MCIVFMICERSIASLRMRLNVSLPFCPSVGSESSAKTSDRATTRLFSMLCLREKMGWITSDGDYRLHLYQWENVSIMSAGIKPTHDDASETKSLPNSRRVYINGKLPGVRVP